jgi:glycosyltransferase involved in cell wall biosynthesis
MGRKKEKIRIMQLASGDLWAGAEAVVFELCKGLSSIEDIELCAVILNNGRLSELCCASGIRTLVIDEQSLGTTGIVKELIKITRSFRPHIIHSHRYKENIIASLCAVTAGFPKLVTTVHGLPEAAYSSKTRMILLINSLIMRYLFSAVVSVSNDIMRHLAKAYGSNRKLKRIYNGIDIPEAFNKIPGSFVLGSAGRLVKIKDFPLLIEAAGLVHAEQPDAMFLLAGDGPEKEVLNEKIRDLELTDNFEINGHVKDMNLFYKSLDIYVNTSQHEGIPMTILEAMARGIPVVAPAVGGIPEIITSDEDGILVKERTAPAFARSLLALINSPEKIQKIGLAARKRIKDEFSNSKMTSAYHDLYSELVLPGKD